MKLSENPADFWIGVGLVAEAPPTIMAWLLPNDFCATSAIGKAICPPPLWPIVTALIVWFFIVAWAANKAGFGVKK